MAKNQRTERTVCITGATDGIGQALAYQYQQQGARLILIGRRALTELDPKLYTNQTYCRADLAWPDCHQIVKQFFYCNSIDRLDLLIHNAGIGFYGQVAQQSPNSIRTLVMVNLQAPIALTHALLPWLTPARGALVFISSVAADLPCPDYAVYGATKAAIDGFARSLRVELQGSVAVEVIHPGATRTRMHLRSGASLEELGWERFTPPERVARRIIRAINRRRPSVTLGLGNQMLVLGGRHLSWLVDQFVARRVR